MLSDEVKSLLAQHFPDCDIAVEGEGSNFQIVIVGDVFASLNAVKRQQSVYAALSQQIADGSIHAVTMQTYTVAEWADQAQ